MKLFRRAKRKYRWWPGNSGVWNKRIGSLDRTDYRRPPSRNRVVSRHQSLLVVMGLVLILGGLAAVFHKLGRVSQVECHLQGDICSAALETYLSSWVGRLLTDKSQALAELETRFPRIANADIQLQLPNKWRVIGSYRQPTAQIISQSASSQITRTEWVDDDGVVLNEGGESDLPILKVNPSGQKRDEARWTDTRVLNSLKVIHKFNTVINLTMESAYLDGNRLTLLATEGKTLIFDPNKDVDNQLATLQAILTEARITNNQLGRTIDLSDTRPVVF